MPSLPVHHFAHDLCPMFHCDPYQLPPCLTQLWIQNPFWMHILEKDGTMRLVRDVFSQCLCALILIGARRGHNPVEQRTMTVLDLVPLLPQNQLLEINRSTPPVPVVFLLKMFNFSLIMRKHQTDPN